MAPGMGPMVPMPAGSMGAPPMAWGPPTGQWPGRPGAPPGMVPWPVQQLIMQQVHGPSFSHVPDYVSIQGYGHGPASTCMPWPPYGPIHRPRHMPWSLAMGLGSTRPRPDHVTPIPVAVPVARCDLPPCVLQWIADGGLEALLVSMGRQCLQDESKVCTCLNTPCTCVANEVGWANWVWSA